MAGSCLSSGVDEAKVVLARVVVKTIKEERISISSEMAREADCKKIERQRERKDRMRDIQYDKTTQDGHPEHGPKLQNLVAAKDAGRKRTRGFGLHKHTPEG